MGYRMLWRGAVRARILTVTPKDTWLNSGARTADDPARYFTGSHRRPPDEPAAR